MSGSVNQPRDADIDIAKLFSAIWRDKFKILLVSLVLTGLVFVLLSMMAPKYKADARVILEDNNPVFTRAANENGNERDTLLDEQGISSQVDILTSSELLIRVANDMQLGSKAEFDEAMDIGAIKSILITLGLASDPRALSKDERVLRAVRDKLAVYARENSRIIVIEFTSEDKDLSWQFPNALAQAYVELESRAALDSTGNAAAYLATEVDSLQRSLREAERRVADFRAQSGLLVGQNNEVLATQQLAELTTELTRIRSERATAESRATTLEGALQSGAAIDALPDVIDSPIVNRLREQEINLKSELAELSVTLLDNHPQVRALRSQLDDLSAQIRIESGKVLTALRSEASIARSREAELTRSLNELKAASVSANEQSVELNALEREAASQRALLESYLIRLREAQSRQETDYAPAKARVISSATTPLEPSFPKMIPMLIATFVGSVLMMAMLSILTELFSGRALIAAPQQGAVSVSPQVDEQIMADEPVRPARASILSAAAAKPNKRGAVTGTIDVDELAAALIAAGASRAIMVSPEGDEASVASVALVRSLSANGLHAILLDLTGSGSASQFMVGPEAPGITDLLAANASYGSVIHPDHASDAHCVPLGKADPQMAARGIARLPIVLNALSEAYDMVVVECGPSDATGLSNLIDPGSEIVLAALRPRASIVRAATSELKEAGYPATNVVDANVAVGSPPSSRRRFAG